ncbi:hypothetical protein AKO1_015779 [Acrasis kona]|uniref:Uncharacterized protein n=1 Tax=Acrasis kona TaxID=1008807 RepID=A0AAW2ZGJ6_9EUKA
MQDQEQPNKRQRTHKELKDKVVEPTSEVQKLQKQISILHAENVMLKSKLKKAEEEVLHFKDTLCNEMSLIHEVVDKQLQEEAEGGGYNKFKDGEIKILQYRLYCQHRGLHAA